MNVKQKTNKMKNLILIIVVLAFTLNILKAQEDVAMIIVDSEYQSIEAKSVDVNYFDIIPYQNDLSVTESIILDSISKLFAPGLWAYEDNIVLKTKNWIEISLSGNYPGMITIQFQKSHGCWMLSDSIQWMAYQNSGGVEMISELYMSYNDMLEEKEWRNDRKQELLSYNDTVKSQMQLVLSEKLFRLMDEGKKSIALDNISISYIGRYSSEFVIRVGIAESDYVSGGDIDLAGVGRIDPNWKTRNKIDDRDDFIYFVLRRTKNVWLFEEGESYRYHNEFGLNAL